MLAVVMVGAVFSTSTLAVDVAAEPLESVAVAVQVMEDPTSVSVCCCSVCASCSDTGSSDRPCICGREGSVIRICSCCRAT